MGGCEFEEMPSAFLREESKIITYIMALEDLMSAGVRLSLEGHTERELIRMPSSLGVGSNRTFMVSRKVSSVQGRAFSLRTLSFGGINEWMKHSRAK